VKSLRSGGGMPIPKVSADGKATQSGRHRVRDLLFAVAQHNDWSPLSDGPFCAYVSSRRAPVPKADPG